MPELNAVHNQRLAQPAGSDTEVASYARARALWKEAVMTRDDLPSYERLLTQDRFMSVPLGEGVTSWWRDTVDHIHSTTERVARDYNALTRVLNDTYCSHRFCMGAAEAAKFHVQQIEARANFQRARYGPQSDLSACQRALDDMYEYLELVMSRDAEVTKLADDVFDEWEVVMNIMRNLIKVDQATHEAAVKGESQSRANELLAQAAVPHYTIPGYAPLDLPDEVDKSLCGNVPSFKDFYHSKYGKYKLGGDNYVLIEKPHGTEPFIAHLDCWPMFPEPFEGFKRRRSGSKPTKPFSLEVMETFGSIVEGVRKCFNVDLGNFGIDYFVPSPAVDESNVPASLELAGSGDQVFSDQSSLEPMTPTQAAPKEVVPTQVAPKEVVPTQAVPKEVVPTQVVPKQPPMAYVTIEQEVSDAIKAASARSAPESVRTPMSGSGARNNGANKNATAKGGVGAEARVDGNVVSTGADGLSRILGWGQSALSFVKSHFVEEEPKRLRREKMNRERGVEPGAAARGRGGSLFPPGLKAYKFKLGGEAEPVDLQAVYGFRKDVNLYPGQTARSGALCLGEVKRVNADEDSPSNRPEPIVRYNQTVGLVPTRALKHAEFWGYGGKEQSDEEWPKVTLRQLRWLRLFYHSPYVYGIEREEEEEATVLDPWTGESVPVSKYQDYNTELRHRAEANMVPPAANRSAANRSVVNQPANDGAANNGAATTLGTTTVLSAPVRSPGQTGSAAASPAAPASPAHIRSPRKVDESSRARCIPKTELPVFAPPPQNSAATSTYNPGPGVRPVPDIPRLKFDPPSDTTPVQGTPFQSTTAQMPNGPVQQRRSHTCAAGGYSPPEPQMQERQMQERQMQERQMQERQMQERQMHGRQMRGRQMPAPQMHGRAGHHTTNAYDRGAAPVYDRSYSGYGSPAIPGMPVAGSPSHAYPPSPSYAASSYAPFSYAGPSYTTSSPSYASPSYVGPAYGGPSYSSHSYPDPAVASYPINLPPEVYRQPGTGLPVYAPVSRPGHKVDYYSEAKRLGIRTIEHI
ncbi:hypothetical protein GNI_035360 [Gregarina niphandrodes]|uniref:Uncharacterized protein n=1 Tax=Gregarina niphandrodes TaxID=110365 RepID=A0A023BAX2_GRENI|nr:hypothetical protein GNI_035360 [Gregarina niphandrodes]EZG78506.1 hypothetical protein GNI_035360 [Gregarina niphandrodes]|eukprot:XP_011129273.1 hypothetical protein GNI_035360 [Gregarina niphandrodes]